MAHTPKKYTIMITHQELLDNFEYHSETGIFYRKTPTRLRMVGSPCQRGYIRICLNKKIHKAHRLAWLYIHGKFPNNQIDHINGITNDNRISNLRDVSSLENQRNRKNASNNTSGVIGVNWVRGRGKWHSQIQIEGKKIWLGNFTDKQDAIDARKDAEIKYNFHPNHGR